MIPREVIDILEMATADAQQHKPNSRRSRNPPPSPENEFLPNNISDTTALTTTTTDGQHSHHHHHHHRRQHSHGQSEKSKSKSRPTKQLDFDQAMADFKTMFPTMDCEIIEAVLRANDGAVDSTIDQLLTMSIDSEGRESPFEIPPELLSPVEDCPTYNEHRSEDSPPSYTEAVQNSNNNSIWTTPISSLENSAKSTSRNHGRSHSMSSKSHRKSHKPHRSKSLFDPDIDELSLSNTEPKRPQSSYLTHSTPVKTGFRNWNPPMLGNLPDDFLRLTFPAERSSVDTNLDFDEKPRVHHRRNRHSRIGSERQKLFQSVFTEDANISKPTRLSRSMSERSPMEPLLRTRNTSSSSPMASQCLIISSHEFTQGMLDKKMKENERRRKTAVMNADPEMSQYLEDERLAIMLQNSEFLQELRGNEEFMQTLERDRIKKHDKHEVTRRSQESAELPDVPRLLPISKQENKLDWLSEVPETRTSDVQLSFNDDEKVSIEGYGDDRQQELDAFPFSQPVVRDDDAELRHKLKDMSGASRKQFMALARKFFSRRKSKKMTLKQIQKEKLAPSMMNLLDSDQEDFNEEENTNNSPYNQETEIEPLPTSVISVPGHKYVQRPPYHTDTIVTYHDNMGSDMV